MLFKYKAIKDNKTVSRQIQAENQEAVLRFLKTSDYFPVLIQKVEQSPSSLFNFMFKRVSFTDIVNLTREIAIMMNAGLTLIDSLDILKKQTVKESLLEIIESIDKEIRAGNKLSVALAQYPQYFSSIYIALVKSGEASGKLNEIFLKLADNMEKERAFRGKLKGALIYPAIIIAAMGIVTFIMVTFVVPQLLNLYKDFEIELPLSTRIMIAISSFFAKFWPFIIAGAVTSVFLLGKYFKTKQGKFMFDKNILKIPIIGNVIKMSTLVDTTRTLAILIGAGVSLLEGLQIIVETSGNMIYQNAFIEVKKKVEKGISLGTAMKQAEIFLPVLVQMTMVGEQTGHLDETLMRISKYFEMESELEINAMTTMIEPAILVLLGIGVAFLVMAVITPLYSLTATFK